MVGGLYTATSREDFAVKSRLSMIERYIQLDGKTVVDVGCGNGIYTIEIAKKAKYVMGIDCNKEFLKIAIKNASNENIGNIDFICAFAESFQLKQKFDVAIMIEVLEHVENEILTLKNIYRHLNENGILVLFVPNKFWPFETHGANINGRLISLGVLGFPFLSWAPEFIRKKYAGARIYTKSALKRLLIETGFKPLYFDYYFPPLDKINSRIAKIIRRIYPYLTKLPNFIQALCSISIFCICKKTNLSKLTVETNLMYKVLKLL